MFLLGFQIGFWYIGLGKNNMDVSFHGFESTISCSIALVFSFDRLAKNRHA